MKKMSPGIMFLGGGGGGGEGGEGQGRKEQQQQEKPVQLKDLHRAPEEDGAEKTTKTNGTRADSPGYFTLSDSDGASNPGTPESPREEDAESGNKQNKEPVRNSGTKQQIYKMFKSTNNNSSSSAFRSEVYQEKWKRVKLHRGQVHRKIIAVPVC